MSRALSPGSGKPYGLARVCRVWRAARSTVYRRRGPARAAPPRRPGPVGPMPDAALVDAIRGVLAASPFHGEGHRKVWALQLAEAAARLHRAIRHAQRVGTTEAGRRLVAAGHGIAVLPDGMVRPFEAAMGIRGIPLAEEWSRRRHRLLLREEALPAPARRLLDHLRQMPRRGG